MRVVADAGRIVRAGDTLALIASPEFGQADADARRSATDLELAERTLGRTRDLFAHGVVAQKDVFAAAADSARARAEADRAQARVAQYGGNAASVNQVFALRAPLGGSVVQRNITPGEEVRPDQMLASTPELVAPLFAVTDPSRLWVQLDVPERDLASVREGAPIAVRVQAWPDQAFRGTLTLVGSAVDPGTRTIKVRGTVDNPERRLKAEMLVTVDVMGPSRTGVVVPAAAVLLVGDAHVVFVREVPGRYRRAAVTVGAASADRVTLTGGVGPDDVVVTEGSLLLEQLFQSHARS